MKSFELVAQNRMSEATSIFTTFAYLNNKRVLKDGSVRFLDTLDAELAAANTQRYRLGLMLLAAISAVGAIGFWIVGKRLNVALVKAENAFIAADAKIRGELVGAHAEILLKTRLAQLGSLTATMAHELRNPLSGVRAAAFLLKKRLAEKNPNIESLFERINKGVVRCDGVISQLLDYSRTGVARTLEVDFDTWLADIVEEAAQTLPPMVEIECTLGLDGRKLNFDIERMQRVVFNLMSNASEAMVG
jgi:signal transduction histidine kinase